MPGEAAALHSLGREDALETTTRGHERDLDQRAVRKMAWPAAELQTDDSWAEVASQTVLHQEAVFVKTRAGVALRTLPNYKAC